MKKNLSYLFPLVAILVIAILAFRWLNAKPETPGQVSSSAEGIEISDVVSDEERPNGVADVETVELESTSQTAAGEIRLGQPLETGERVFTLMTNLPDLREDEGKYQVWFEGEKGVKKAMQLVFNKGGYMAEGKLSAEFESVKVIVSQEKTDDTQLEEVLLQGQVNLNEEVVEELE